MVGEKIRKKGLTGMNPSPLRYPGGKYKLYKYVAELIKENNCNTYIEPFCGGAAIALELLFNNIVRDVVINDYDYTIYCFWDSVLHQTDEFIEMVLHANVTLEEWHRQKAIRDDLDNHNSLEIGFSTFFLNRTNRSGIIDKAGPIGGFLQQGDYPIDCRFNKERLVSQIRKIGDKRDCIKLYNLEALDFIDDVILKTRKAFIFFDPPYYGKGPGLYTNFYSHGDHVNLARAILNKLKSRKWIVTYDNINAIKSMYHKVNYIEFALQYSLQSKRSGSEIMFFSKQVYRPQQEQKYITMIQSEEV
ncbi:MAG: DNA adenine methylase [Lachnospiraceae bacterium]|nr:DNA adenine methylase [Lachnospiraceae bacterium]MCM1238037.1 DNA adenine methylase [Lachnospiraceae bacterium]